MNEAQTRRLAAMLTEKQQRDILTLAQIIRETAERRAGKPITERTLLAPHLCGAKALFRED